MSSPTQVPHFKGGRHLWLAIHQSTNKCGFVMCTNTSICMYSLFFLFLSLSMFQRRIIMKTTSVRVECHKCSLSLSLAPTVCVCVCVCVCVLRRNNYMPFLISIPGNFNCGAVNHTGSVVTHVINYTKVSFQSLTTIAVSHSESSTIGRGPTGGNCLPIILN